MKKTIKSLKISSILLFVICAFIACDKDFNTIESDVIGSDNSNINTNSKTWPVISYNKKLDSLQINNLGNTALNTTSSGNLLGVFNDPAYGTTKASIVAQITPNIYNPSFGENPVIDKVILTIPYYSTVTDYDSNGDPLYKLDSVYGNVDTPIKLSIYRNNYYLRDFDPYNPENVAQNYYSKGSHTTNAVLNGSSLIEFDNHIIDPPIYYSDEFKPNAEGITSDDDEDLPPSLRIQLDNDYWKTVILDKENDPVLNDESSFKNYFRGLYFKAETKNSNDGSMLLLNLTSSNANITIYYTTSDGYEGTYVLKFSGNILNTFINDYNIQLENGDKTLGDDQLYLKGTEGSMAVVELFSGQVDCNGDGNFIDAIDCFKKTHRQLDENGNYIKHPTTQRFLLKKLINEAQLILTEKDNLPTGGDDNFHKYDRIYAYNIKDNSTLADYNYDETKNTSFPLFSNIRSLGQRSENGVYKIRLTHHLNNILYTDSIKADTPTKIGLVLSNNVNYTTNAEILDSEDEVTAIPKASILSPRGTILQGNTNAVPEGERIKLKIFYSENK